MTQASPIPEARRRSLESQHAELDRKIEDLELHPSVDPAELADLKRRKLAIRDELAGHR